MKKFLGYGILYIIGLFFIIGMFIKAPETNNNVVKANSNKTTIVYNNK